MDNNPYKIMAGICVDQIKLLIFNSFDNPDGPPCDFEQIKIRIGIIEHLLRENFNSIYAKTEQN